jgi:hypothetical protein
VCPQNYYCTGGTAGRAACASGYITSGTGSTSSGACYLAPISSATSPSGCSSYTTTTDVTENNTYGCSGVQIKKANRTA